MLFLVDALANAKSLFSANFLAFPAVADATLGLLSKMANLALTNPWWLGLRILLLVRFVSSKTCNFDRTIPSQICNLCCCTAFPPPGILGFLLSRSLDSFSTTRLINESERKIKKKWWFFLNLDLFVHFCSNCQFCPFCQSRLFCRNFFFPSHYSNCPFFPNLSI